MKKKISKPSIYNERRFRRCPLVADICILSCFRNKPWQKKRWHLPVFIYTIHGVEKFGICLRL